MNAWSKYWLTWFFVSFVAFIVPEVWALITGHDENTLSENVWRLEKIPTGGSLWHWTALHVLLGGSLLVVLVWLIGHLVFGIWR